jgi:hypothetical protein
MTARVRETLVSRRSWLLAGATVSLSRAFEEQLLQVRYDGDTLRVTIPSLHFLSGKPLERLKDGDAVAYLANLELLDDSKSVSFRRQKGRFVVSYALWEEKFSVTQLASTPVTADNLSMQAAELWCVDSLALTTLGLAADRYYWLRFGISTASASDLASEGIPGLKLSTLIGWLGRKPSVPTHWGPLERRVRLADLPRVAGRGSRG